MFKITTFSILLCLTLGCKFKKTPTVTNSNIPNTIKISNQKDTTSHRGQVKSNDLAYFSDSVFHGNKAVLAYYFKKYSSDTCFLWTDKEKYTDSMGVDGYNEIRKLGAIRKNIKTSVFVLDPLSYCSSYTKRFNEQYYDGQAYYFTDTTLPRLQSDSYCCHPSNIFLVGDIDEDGIAEVGQYFSSCVSHYKSLWVYTLKNNQWKMIGHSVFDQHYMYYDRPFSSHVKKAGKGKFMMYEKTDLSSDSTDASKGHWLTFTM